MQRYLTKKARPGRGVQLMENAALILLTGLFALCVWFLASMAVMAWERQLFSLKLLLPLIPAVLLALAMNPIAERIRARHHAQLIVKALLERDGRIPADEVEDVTGVRRGADYALQLVEKGYVKDVRLAQGFLCVADVAEAMPPAEAVKPLFRDVEV